MKKTLLYLSLALFFAPACLFSGPFAQESSAWQEVRTEAGIQLYTASVSGTDIKKVKAVVEVGVSLDALQLFLNKVAHYPLWVPYLKEARILEKSSEDDLLAYNFFDAPWPARDRDFVYRIQITRELGQVLYVMQSQESDLMPVQKSATRAVLIESRYVLTPLNEHSTRLEMTFHADPKGKLPMWIVNIVHRIIPHDALRELRRLVESPN